MTSPWRSLLWSVAAAVVLATSNCGGKALHLPDASEADPNQPKTSTPDVLPPELSRVRVLEMIRRLEASWKREPEVPHSLKNFPQWKSSFQIPDNNLQKSHWPDFKSSDIDSEPSVPEKKFPWLDPDDKIFKLPDLKVVNKEPTGDDINYKVDDSGSFKTNVALPILVPIGILLCFCRWICRCMSLIRCLCPEAFKSGESEAEAVLVVEEEARPNWEEYSRQAPLTPDLDKPFDPIPMGWAPLNDNSDEAPPRPASPPPPPSSPPPPYADLAPQDWIPSPPASPPPSSHHASPLLLPLPPPYSAEPNIPRYPHSAV